MPFEPLVDVLICTVGRPSLRQAIVSALSQTYRHARCVVLGDGPSPEARACYEATVRESEPAVYVESPRRLGPWGNRVRQWWVEHGESAPYLKPLGDDDLLAPTCVAEMVRPMEDPEVAVVSCRMLLLYHSAGRPVKERMVSGALEPGQIGGGSVLVRTAAAAGLQVGPHYTADFDWIMDVAGRGRHVAVPLTLYWYLRSWQ